ncbi:MAG: DEAD/DEAH box helicase, partial [Romboutsia timonensis]|uniref:DEAD/DEAH box helicase n=1 Tax=Romboutsia timonensis TaxID=1776391 RepID=UPI003995431A
YNPNIHYFEGVDEELVDIIEDFGRKNTMALNSFNAKFLDVGSSGLKRFLKTLGDKEFTLTYNNEIYLPKVINEKLPINLDLEKCDENIELKCNNNLPMPLTHKGDVVLYDENIYLLSNEDARNYKTLYSILKDHNNIAFTKEEIDPLLTNLVPKVKSFSKNINIDNEIKDNIVNDFNTKFYFDLKNSNIVCELKFEYDDENKTKYVVRNLEKEKIFKDKLLSLNFINNDSYYVFNGSDEELFNFLDIEIMNLKSLGDVYYSDKFKNRKIIKSTSIHASIRDSLDGYLNFSFNIDDINQNEYKDMFLAFKEKKRFYKLKNGSFLDLEDSETKDLFELVENLNVSSFDDSKVHFSKALYINDMFKSKNLNFIEGKQFVNRICDDFDNIENLDLSIPKNLKANLRDYQVAGLNYFKTLDHYKFGGILADEMGLGKTLQTISFLLYKKENVKNTKSLIVTPTSLIYNWKSEFENFAPDIKVLLIHGNKKEREKLLNTIDEYDVVITTYATLRNDLDFYETKVFDYFIIDEAQNIKNPISLSTNAVKSINSKVRFALTGTPIENNLLELWSIFDFVMPGYLYSRNKFQDLFIYDEYNANNLRKLIKPFILRRTKSQVMTELPDKIENKFFVELNKDQRKVYSAYVEEIKEKINNKDIKTDKITMFSYLTKLRQLCLDPSVLIEGYNKKSSKTEATLEILKDYIEDNHKILLFSQFTSVLKNIGKELSKNNIDYYYIDGQTNALERLNLVNKFNEGEDVKVFLISLKAGGSGLNLTSADVVIHFDPWWNPAVENQASDRAHRFGQKNVVHVIKLIAKGTIEENIIKLQENKDKLIKDFINDDLSNSGLLNSLSDKDIIDLFS